MGRDEVTPWQRRANRACSRVSAIMGRALTDPAASSDYRRRIGMLYAEALALAKERESLDRWLNKHQHHRSFGDTL